MTRSAAAFVAWRYLLGRGKEGGRYLRGAALGIALSLVPIVVVLVVSDGMIRGITDRFLELGTYHIEAFDRRPGDEPALQVAALKALPGVAGVYPERQGLGILVGKGGKSGATVRAVSPLFLQDPGSRRYLRAVDGAALLSGPDDALLGSELAKKTGAKVGDRVRLMTASTGSDGRTVPRVSSYTVKGIVSSGYRELDALWLFIPYDAGRRCLSSEASRSVLGIKIDEPYKKASEAAALVQAALPAGFETYTWYELQSSQYRSYQSTKQLLLFIMALIVLVAAVNVSSATTMLAVERRRDIAILKSFGAHPRDGERILLYGALFTGLVGSLAGVGLGLLLGVNADAIIRGGDALLGLAARAGAYLSGSGSVEAPHLLDPAYYLERIPVAVDWAAIGALGVCATLGSAFAAWLPARRAGRLAPIEILRKY